MKKNIIFRVFCLIFCLLTHSQKYSAMTSVDQKSLSQQLNQLLASEPSLNGSIVGVSIRSASNGQLIYDHLGDIRMRPASNMKLLTAASALSVLGEDYTFTTEVRTDGPVKKKELNGNLYLIGKGDPTLLKSNFNKMAEEVQRMGIKKVKGDLIGDDNWYDHIRYSIDLPWSDEGKYYGAAISALTASPTTDFDAGTIKFEIKPAKQTGRKAEIRVIPKTNFLKINNQTQTVGEQEKNKITIEREHLENEITIKGTIPLHARKRKEWISVSEPTLYSADLFRRALKEHGIEILGNIKTGYSPENAILLTSHQSIPLSELLIPFMKMSNNTHAEILVKEMAKVKTGEGSWRKGLMILKSEIKKFGVNPNTMVLRDGSGISHVDLIPANQISQLLFSIQKEKWFPTYIKSLPVSGSKEKMVGGTLRKRFRNSNLKGKVIAKTGTISTVSSLSGYVKTKKGNTIIFSILLNNLLDDQKGKIIEDKMVTIMANH